MVHERPLSFCAGLAVLLLPELCHAGESLATTLVNAGIRQASLAAAGPLPLVETVCGLMQQQAEANGLPPLPFVRLIWKESRFDPQAISPKGAKGIAQFMPGTAEDRGVCALCQIRRVPGTLARHPYQPTPR